MAKKKNRGKQNAEVVFEKKTTEEENSNNQEESKEPLQTNEETKASQNGLPQAVEEKEPSVDKEPFQELKESNSTLILIESNAGPSELLSSRKENDEKEVSGKEDLKDDIPTLIYVKEKPNEQEGLESGNKAIEEKVPALIEVLNEGNTEPKIDKTEQVVNVEESIPKASQDSEQKPSKIAVEAPVEARIEAPVEVPVEIFIKAPAEAPVEVPNQDVPTLIYVKEENSAPGEGITVIEVGKEGEHIITGDHGEIVIVNDNIPKNEEIEQEGPTKHTPPNSPLLPEDNLRREEDEILDPPNTPALVTDPLAENEEIKPSQFFRDDKVPAVISQDPEVIAEVAPPSERKVSSELREQPVIITTRKSIELSGDEAPQLEEPLEDMPSARFKEEDAESGDEKTDKKVYTERGSMINNFGEDDGRSSQFSNNDVPKFEPLKEEEGEDTLHVTPPVDELDVLSKRIHQEDALERLEAIRKTSSISNPELYSKCSELILEGLVQKGQLEAAVKHAEESILISASPYLYFLCAKAYERLGQKGKQSQLLKKSLDLLGDRTHEKLTREQIVEEIRKTNQEANLQSPSQGRLVEMKPESSMIRRERPSTDSLKSRRLLRTTLQVSASAITGLLLTHYLVKRPIPSRSGALSMSLMSLGVFGILSVDDFKVKGGLSIGLLLTLLIVRTKQQ